LHLACEGLPISHHASSTVKITAWLASISIVALILILFLQKEPANAQVETEAAQAPEQSAAPDFAAPPLTVPVQGLRAQDLNDNYEQPRGDGRIHEALDIMAPKGTPVVAVEDGTIVKLFDSVPGGLTVYQYDPSGERVYYYAHLHRYATNLKEGQAVRGGGVIGYVGSSGNADPLAPHLHFSIFRLGPEKQWWTGTPINPYPLFQYQPQ
jgi:murein DD-endopeptidase MepM/ murein hydrolase activator NlpD